MGLPLLIQDLSLNVIAKEYVTDSAALLLNRVELVQNRQEQMMVEHKLKTLIFKYDLFEDEMPNKEQFKDKFFDFLNLIEDLKNQQADLFDPSFTSCGMNMLVLDESFYVVVLLGVSEVEVCSIKKNALGNLLISGRVVPNKGLYAVRIIEFETKKQIDIISPHHISFQEKS